MSSYPPPENNSPIYNPGTYTTDTSSLNIEDGDKRYLKLTGSISSGLQTFNGNISTEKIFSSGNEYSFPAVAGTIALSSEIPDVSNFVTLTTDQAIYGLKVFEDIVDFNGGIQGPLAISGNVNSTTGNFLSSTASASGASCNYQLVTTNNGLRASVANEVRITTGGSDKIIVTTGSIQHTLQNRFVSGTVTVPGISWTSDTGNNSGWYLIGNDNIGGSINGIQTHQWDSTGFKSLCYRPLSSTRITMAPVTDNTTGSAQLRITPSSAGWDSTGLAYLELGDSSHQIFAQHSFGMEIQDTNAINLNSGNHVNVYDNGTTNYFCIGDLTGDPIGDNSYGLAFGSGASGSSLSVFSSVSHTVKIGRDNNGDAIRFYRNNGASVTAVGSISLTTTNTTYNTTSDRRLKENLIPIDDALSIINQVQTYSYNFKNDDTKQTFRGVIADEIQQLMPEVVTGSPDSIDEYGNINPQMVDYSKIVPYLIRAIQQLSV
jgi:hypothetical protein